jgi:imidazolonepropionase-like amidohydrolase
MTRRTFRAPSGVLPLTPSLSICVVGVLMAVALLRADAPRVYAIQGARIVTAAGSPVESGSIVFREGRIEAVGASVAIPPDADVIEGKGLIVYPGLVDLGNMRAADQAQSQQPPGLRTTAEVERWKRSQIFHPQVRAADLARVDSNDLIALASAGITTVLATPPGEVLSGQSALFNVEVLPEPPQIGNIAEPRRGLAVVKTPVALHVSFPDHPRVGGSAYPESQMGVIAFVRQAFLDAQHYGAAQSRAQRLRAADRPADDPALEALQPALEHKISVAFEANEAREILRVLRIARDFKLDPIVTGGRNAEEVTADLRAEHARVIYSLNYPQRPKSLAPDADEPLKVLRERADAPKVPAELAKAGIPFAFESAGLAEPKDFLRNAAKAVKAGLPADAAIRALTITAATIAGAADRLGSLESGKMANIIVTDGDLFEERTVIKHVFVAGHPVQLEQPATRPGGEQRHQDGAEATAEAGSAHHILGDILKTLGRHHSLGSWWQIQFPQDATLKGRRLS